MKTGLSLSLLLAFCQPAWLLEQAAGGVELFVSPGGSDAYPGTLERPFATLVRAKNEIRLLITRGLKEDVQVNLRAGTHSLAETLILGLEDAAPEGYTITWRGYEDEKAVLSSGVKVTGWQRLRSPMVGLSEEAAAHVWMADIPHGLGGILTLYKGESRLNRARTQGFAPDTDIHPRDNPSDTLDWYTLHFPEGAVKNWPNLEDVELFILPSFPWWMNILSFASVDETKRIARTTIPGTDPLCLMVKYARRGFEENAWIENVPEGLVSPGQWMVDTVTRKIYYWPAEGEPGHDIYAPALRELIRVEGGNDQLGSADRPVTGLCFHNLHFTKADRGVWDADDTGIQHDWEMLDKDNAMLRFRGAQDCRVDRCRFYNAGGNAIRLDLYAQKIAIKNSLFHNLGQSAVMMIGYGPGTKDVNKHNRVVNNHIHHCGEIYWHSQMITAFQSGHNLIAHNHVHHVPRKAVCISGVRDHFLKDGETDRRECVNTIRWPEIGKAITHEELLPFLHSRHNVIEYNNIHDVLQRLGDGSAINLSGSGVGNVVRFNYIHDIPAVHATCGIRMDEDQTETLIEKNVIVNMGMGGIVPKQENTIRNNFIIQVCNHGNAGMIRALGGGNGGLATIQHNILYNTHPSRAFYTRQSLAYSQEQIAARIDHNVYFCPGTSLENWADLVLFKTKGADRHSLFADPLFADWRKGDFTLKPNSPALKLGIQQVDISAAGLTDQYPRDWR